MKAEVSVSAIPDFEQSLEYVSTGWYLQSTTQMFGLQEEGCGQGAACESPCCQRPVFSCSWSTIDSRRGAFATGAGHKNDYRCEACGSILEPLPTTFKIKQKRGIVGAPNASKET